MKKIVSFLNNGWVNLFSGLLILFGSVYLILPYQDSFHSLSVLFGIALFMSSDIMGYGFSTLLAGRRKKKDDTPSTE